jgi:signal transduction histidine kinase
VEPFNAYLNDKKNGATMLSVALGHTADALCHCLREVRELGHHDHAPKVLHDGGDGQKQTPERG